MLTAHQILSGAKNKESTVVNIREMDITDYDAVIALWCQTEGMSLRGADSRASIEHYLQRNPNLSFVALNNRQIVAALLVGTDGRRGYLQHLAVSPQFRGQRLGRALVMQSVAALAKQGIAKTHLFVHNDNINAQQFYEKLGWFSRDDLRTYSYNSASNANA